MSRTQRGYFYMLLSAATFASVSVFMKGAYAEGMNPWSFSAVQSTFALLQLLLLKLRERPLPVPGPKPPWLLLTLFAVSGGVAGLAFNLALVYLSISLGTILFFTYPAFVALGAWLFRGERPNSRRLLALGLTLVGAVMTMDPGGARVGQVSLLGVGLALLAGASQGAYIVAGDLLGSRLSAVSATMITRGAIALGAVLIHPAVLAEVFSLSGKALLMTLGAGVVGGVVPILALYKGIALIGATPAAILSVAELPFALVLGRIFEGDQARPVQMVGALLIGLAVLFSQGRPDRPETAGGVGQAAGAEARQRSST